ncbi:MAG: hypothetical protein ISS25_02905 [Nanoarchaeota archaeon]|nr:hypothetical protein [DPANN group archaeon]MBL7116750.1 hypothetical protein [Nanoarchaeota archaeon]
MGDFKDRLENIVDKCYDWLIDNPEVGSGLVGLTTLGVVESYFWMQDLLSHANSLRFQLEGLALSSTATFFSYMMIRADNILKQLGVNYRETKKKLKLKSFQRKEHRNIAEKVVDSIVEHPLPSGIALMGLIGTGANLHFIDKLGWDFWYETHLSNFKEVLSKDVLLLVLGSYPGKKLFEFAGPFLHSSNFSSNISNLKFKLSKLFGKKENLFLAYRSSIHEENYDIVLFEYADLCFELGKTNEAFEALKTAHERIGFEDFFHKAKGVALVGFKNRLKTYYARLQKNPLSLSNYFGVAFSLLKIDERDKAVELMHSFTTEAEKNPELALNANLSEALFLRNIGEEELFIDRIIKVLTMWEDKLEHVGTHEVYTIADNDFSNHTFRFRKSSDRENLVAERLYNEQIKRKFDEVNDEVIFRIIDPPEVIPVNGCSYGVTVYETGKMMYPYLNSTLDIDSLKDVARFMARIHGANLLYSAMTEEYYINQLKERIEQVDNPELGEVVKILFNNIPVLFSGFGVAPRVVDVDGHLFNWNKGRYYTKIDNQAREPTLPFYECSKMLEQGGILPLDHDGDALRNRVLAEYHRELSNFHDIIPFDQFLIYKLQSDLIKAISYFYFALNDPSKGDLAVQFIQNGIHSLHRLKNYVESKHDLTCLDYVEKGVEKLVMV